MSKRLYLCNLIPFGTKDSEHLDVDWVRDAASEGELVEMRVLARDLTLDPADDKLAIRFEIYESDFLLSGGSDDHVRTIGSAATGGEQYEHRALRTLAGAQAPSGDVQESSIFLSAVPAKDSAPAGTLVRAFWKAKWMEDVSGDPEYYFDVAITTATQTYEERADRELSVRKSAGPAAAVAAAKGSLDADEPVVADAGWSTGHAEPGEEVEMIAAIRGGRAGHRVSFDVFAADSSAKDVVLHRVDLILGDSELVRAKWMVPESFPLGGIFAVHFDVTVLETVISSTTRDQIHDYKGQTLFPRLELGANLRLQLVDARGKPLRRTAFRLLLATDGSVIEEGKSDDNGNIDVMGVPGADYELELVGMALLDVAEPLAPEPEVDTTGVMFSFTDVRIGEAR
jgi:hypothetical protein